MVHFPLSHLLGLGQVVFLTIGAERARKVGERERKRKVERESEIEEVRERNTENEVFR